MPSLKFSTESPINFEQKTICCFVVDTSGSMMTGRAIDILNQGLSDFHSEISKDTILANRLEVAIVEFNHEIRIVQEPALAESFIMPTLDATGTTRLVDGVREAIKLVEDRKQWYRETGQPYLRPWIILMTDGSPDADQDTDGLRTQIDAGVDQKKFIFLSLGVGTDVDMAALRHISHHNYAPMKLEGVKFSQFFEWVSASLSLVAASKEGDKVSLPTPTWMESFTIGS